MILSVLFLFVFAIGELAYRYFKVKAEYTRKWSHISSGVLSLLFPYMLDSLLWVGIICGIFILVLNFSKPLGLLPSINAVDRRTYGSILFPLAVFISFAAYTYKDNMQMFFWLPVLTLAISDLAAAIVGKKYPLRPISVYNEVKSLGGYLAFTISALLIYICFWFFNDSISLIAVFALPPIVAIVELYSPRGFDNITIPISVIVGLLVLN